MQEIDNPRDFEIWLNDPNRDTRTAIQALNLTPFKHSLLKQSLKGTLFLGCHMDADIASHLVFHGAMVIPASDGLAFQSHTARLYSPLELLSGFDPNLSEGYKSTLDYRIYQEYLNHGKDNPDSIYITLMRRLHDHSITDALMEAIEGRKIVAIMGGHSMERSDPVYFKVARISRDLTRKGFTMVTGGGPGAMEATHLGAYLALRSLEDLEQAIEILKPRPEGAPRGKEYTDPDWLHRAMRVRECFPLSDHEMQACMSIGIPTWLYGHEPPSAFPTHIAKYFANSVREDGLLTIAKYGVIFSPGSAGTIQEIFQDACQNHYASFHEGPGIAVASPMILLGVDWWTSKKPAWPLLNHLSSNLAYGKLVALTDSETEIVEKIESYDPEMYTFPLRDSHSLRD